jgi:hypothetical protein
VVEVSKVSSSSLYSCWNGIFKQPKKASSFIFYGSILFHILFKINHIIRLN